MAQLIKIVASPQNRCSIMRINVPALLNCKIREMFINKISYGGITMKDVYHYLITLALENYNQGVELNYCIDATVPPSRGAIGTNMEIPIEVSNALDSVKIKLSLNKRDTFLAMLNAGFNLYQTKLINDVPCAAA